MAGRQEVKDDPHFLLKRGGVGNAIARDVQSQRRGWRENGASWCQLEEDWGVSQQAQTGANYGPAEATGLGGSALW